MTCTGFALALTRDRRCASPGGRFLTSGAYLGQPRTLFWADAAETVPLRNLVLPYWGISAAQLLSLSSTHTSIVELNLKVQWTGCDVG